MKTYYAGTLQCLRDDSERSACIYCRNQEGKNRCTMMIMDTDSVYIM